MSVLDKWPAALSSAKGLVKSKLEGYLNKGDALSDSTDPNLKNRNYTVMIKQDRGAESLVIVGTVPQSFQINQSVDWKAPWGAGLGGSGTIGDLVAVTTGNRLVAQVMTMQVWQGSGNDFEFNVQFELRAYSDPVRDVLNPLRSLLKMSLPSLGTGGFLKSPGPILSPAGVAAVAGQFINTLVEGGKLAAEAAAAQKTNDGTKVATAVKKAEAAGTAFSNNAKASGITRKAFIENEMSNKISIQIGQWFYLSNVIITQVQHDIKAQTPERETGVIQSASVTVSFKPVFSLTAEDVDRMLIAGGSIMSKITSPTQTDPRAGARGQQGY